MSYTLIFKHALCLGDIIKTFNNLKIRVVTHLLEAGNIHQSIKPKIVQSHYKNINWKLQWQVNSQSENRKSDTVFFFKLVTVQV